MVVSMDTHTIDNVAESSCDGYTGIAAASTHLLGNNSCKTMPRSLSNDSTEADTTYESYYTLKDSVEKGEDVICHGNPAGVEGDLFSKQLKELIGLQLDLIEYQQLKITNKDKQIMVLKSEKEQLEARICRMERRIALQKRQVEPEDNPIPKPKSTFQIKSTTASNNNCPMETSTSSTTTPAQTPTTAFKSEFQRYEQLLPVAVTSRADRQFKFNTYLKTNFNYLDVSGSKLLPNITQPEADSEIKYNKTEFVSVPSWKVVEITDILVKDPQEEDVTNDAISKRHGKPELEEKRRKRWDLQHLRQQHQQQMLTQNDKVNDKEKVEKTNTDHNFTSLFPNAANVMAIEISNTVPVCVFGYPVPAVSVRELDLPWFSIARREIQLREAKEKLMKKRLKGFSAAKKHTKLKSWR